jgi:serine/threonine protein phosphatase PrpC/DNA-binding transcriptional MerR regulator
MDEATGTSTGMGTAEGDLSIGELARRSGLSPKALRLYDGSDLLPPRHVDPATGYRRYGAEQVERARLIARLRGLGMGLAQIRVICDLPADAAYQELHSWWLQEQADARSRGEGVAALLTELRSLPEKERPMTTLHPAPSRGTPRIASALEIGSVRPTQQDAVQVSDLPDGRVLAAIADGFGTDDGLSAQLLASLASALEERPTNDEDVMSALGSAWERLPDLLPADGSSGAALTAAVLDGDRLVLAHLGDVRALLVRGEHIEPLTRDHTQVASLLAAGRITAEEADAHPQRAVLNRALAAGSPTAPDLIVRTLLPGDRIVLVSDGVHAVLSAQSLGEALLAGGSPQDVVERLSRRTLEAGAPDNLAVIIVDAD